MTRKELNDLFELRDRIERAEYMLMTLRERSNPGAQVLTGMPHTPGVKDKTGDCAVEIVALEGKIACLRETLREKEAEASAFLSSIDDECISTALRLRYIHGMLWKEVAYMVGQSEKNITNRCHNYLKAIDGEWDGTEPEGTDRSE